MTDKKFDLNNEGLFSYFIFLLPIQRLKRIHI